MEEKRFIVRKYVMAKSAKEAIFKEKKSEVHDVFVDDMFLKDNPKVGF